jgi:cytochrome oxidase Cu insertion factor (SCO1/SenC/PrrC family)
MKRVLLILAASALVVAMAVAIGWYLDSANNQIRTGTVTGTGTASIGGDFSLVDQNGQRRTAADFAGKYLLVYFGFTHCVDACPLALLAMSQALDRLPPEIVDRVQPIFITVDPARDDPAQIALYLQNFHPKTVGLTGTVEEIGAAAKAYRVPFDAPKADANGDYQVQHGTIIYLMAPDGSFLAHFEHVTPAGDLAEALQSYVGGGS